MPTERSCRRSASRLSNPTTAARGPTHPARSCLRQSRSLRSPQRRPRPSVLVSAPSPSSSSFVPCAERPPSPSAPASGRLPSPRRASPASTRPSCAPCLAWFPLCSPSLRLCRTRHALRRRQHLRANRSPFGAHQTPQRVGRLGIAPAIIAERRLQSCLTADVKLLVNQIASRFARRGLD